jgi:hypothetical protein
MAGEANSFVKENDSIAQKNEQRNILYYLMEL